MDFKNINRKIQINHTTPGTLCILLLRYNIFHSSTHLKAKKAMFTEEPIRIPCEKQSFRAAHLPKDYGSCVPR